MITGKLLKEQWLQTTRRVISMAPQMCITCGHYKDGRCVEFDSDVPEDYASDLNGCQNWKTMDLSAYYEDTKDIPF